MYGADVRYEYEVGGRSYTSQRIALANVASSDRSAAEGLVARYAEGEVVEVSFDPDNPASAVLERSGGGLLVAPMLFAGIVAFGMAALFIFFERRARRVTADADEEATARAMAVASLPRFDAPEPAERARRTLLRGERIEDREAAVALNGYLRTAIGGDRERAEACFRLVVAPEHHDLTSTRTSGGE